MQLTRFDRWLRETFVYETHIHTISEPARLPRGIVAKPVQDEPGKRYKHLYVARKSKVADAFLRQLKANNQMFTTRIVERDVWFKSLVAPKDKSVTWRLFGLAVGCVSFFFFARFVLTLARNPEVRKNVLDALEVLKG